MWSRKITLVFFLLSQICFAQQAKFTEVKATGTHFMPDATITLSFPIVVLPDKKISEKINETVQRKFFWLNENDSIEIIDSMLFHSISGGMDNLSYHISFSNSEFLSFEISAEGCGAYCSNWTTYFNFDLKTGNEISLNEIINENNFQSFKQKVRADKIAAYEDDSLRIVNSMKENVMDSFFEKDLLQEIKDWKDTINFSKFIFSDSEIIIYDECEFPHVVRSLEPDYYFHFSFDKEKILWNTEFLKRKEEQ